MQRGGWPRERAAGTSVFWNSLQVSRQAMNTFRQMIERGHERVCFHHDPDTGLRAIIGIHSTRLGHALGGVRRWHYATEADALYDVLRLSQAMTYKAAAANLPMGGGKSVILLPKSNHPTSEAEARAMGRFVDTLNGAYIAAADVGVETQFVDWMALETRHIMGGETACAGGDPAPHTALGTMNAMKACLAHRGLGPGFEGVTVAIQGVGNVGYSLARLLTEAGAEVMVADINQSRVDQAVDEIGVKVVSAEEVLTTECDILAPCALGGVIDANFARTLRCRIVAGAANNVLDDPDEDAAVLRRLGILYAPDFVVNAGGLIHLAGLYLGMSEDELQQKIAEIEHTTAQILREAESMSSTHAAAIVLAGCRIARHCREQVHAG